MKNSKLLIYGLIVAAVMLMSTAGNVNAVVPQQSTTTTLIYALPYDFTEFGYFTANSYATQQWLSAVRASLFRRDASNDRLMTPWFAEGYTVSSDSKNYTVTIKPGMKFQDGAAFTADDVVWSYGIYYHEIFGGADSFLNNESVYKIDDLTVQFDMLEAYAFGVNYLTFAILNEAYFGPKWTACEANGAFVEADCLWDDPSGVDAHGGGPFMVSTIDPTNDVVTLVKNPNYMDAANVQVDEIVYQKISNPIAALSALAAGDVDILDSQYVPPVNAFTYFDNVKSIRVADPATQEISVNHQHPMYGTGTGLPLSGTVTSAVEGAKAVREAMSSVLNREFIVQEILEGMGLPAATTMPAASVGWNPNLAYDAYDVQHARDLMTSVGFNYDDLTYDADADAYTTFFFNVTLLSPNTNPARNRWSILFEQSLPKMGVGVTDHVSTGWAEIVPRTFGWSSNTLVPLYDDGGFDLFFVGYGWPLDYDPQYLFDTYGLCDTGSCDNFYNFVNQEITDLVDTYVRELDGNTRITLAHQIQDFLKEWRPVIPIVYPQSHWGFNIRLQGIDGILISTSDQQWDDVYFGDVHVDDHDSSSSTAADDGGFVPLDSMSLFVGIFFSAFVVATVRSRRRD